MKQNEDIKWYQVFYMHKNADRPQAYEFLVRSEQDFLDKWLIVHAK